jgi:hypothetical protein
MLSFHDRDDPFLRGNQEERTNIKPVAQARNALHAIRPSPSQTQKVGRQRLIQNMEPKNEKS